MFRGSVLLLPLLLWMTEWYEVRGQERCATVEFNSLLKDRESVKRFETWMQDQRQLRKNAQMRIQSEEAYLIPVVVHVIHNGEELGVGSNISEAQIRSQIEVLNEDFRRLNQDTLETPDAFLTAAADSRIEFVMAKRDPEGFATNGINRVTGVQSSYGPSDVMLIASQSHWPSDQYLNIWVSTFSFLGLAQLPTSNLDGLDNLPSNEVTDGVVVDYRAFGSSDKGTFPVLEAPYDKGRTLTHEVGHFLGLRHIWGDGGCNVDDFCEDTPLSSSSTGGCPTSKSSCDSPDMFQNFMDYTNDPCMNLFTNDQRDRMHVVLENSPRRNSLLSSPALEEPVVVASDLGIRQIRSPKSGSCDTLVSPLVQVRNYGTGPINQFVINLSNQDSLIESISIGQRLDPLDFVSVNFTEFELNQAQVNNFYFEITEVDGQPDMNPENDRDSVKVISIDKGTFPLFESFEQLPDNWQVFNYDESITWETASYQEDGVEDRAIYINFGDYRDQFETDILVLPSLELANLDSAYLQFRVAYAKYPGYSDGLRVVVSRDCGNSFELGKRLYEKFGEELATRSSSLNTPFVPSTRFDWRTETINLTPYINEGEISLAFIGVNGYGENLYIDDVEINGLRAGNLDLEISNLFSEGLISCESPFVAAEIKNNSRTVIDSFQIQLKVNRDVIYLDTLYGVDLQPNGSYTWRRDAQNLDQDAGMYNLNVEVEVRYPNLSLEANLDNNVISAQVRKAVESQISPPERYEFSAEDPEAVASWGLVNTNDQTSWQIASTSSSISNDGSLFLNYYNEANKGNIDQLISPRLDLTGATDLSVFFDVSYAYNENLFDSLRLVAWDGCDIENKEILFNQGGVELAVTETIDAWEPSDSADWARKFVDLSSLLYYQDPHLAFEAKSGYGNNIYLDEIEFFLDSNPEPYRPELDEIILYPNPAASSQPIKVTFNQSKKSSVLLTLVSSTGQIRKQIELPDVLNQTFELLSDPLEPGLYLLFVETPEGKSVKRLLLF